MSGLLAIAAFFDMAEQNGGYRHAREGVSRVPSAELLFLLWYLVWGGLAVACIAVTIHVFGGRRLVQLFDSWSERSQQVLVLVALPLFASILVLRSWVMLDQPVADDEPVYELSARNLALGRLTSKPPIDPHFLMNQFVVVGPDRWHGKYPIGHSLLLAPFELLGRVDLLGALLALASLALTYSLARRFVGERGALLAGLLLAASPHFVLTHATLLSQTTSCMLMLLSAFASVRHTEDKRTGWLWLIGFALGFGVLTRPMPMVLVAIVVCLDKLFELSRAAPRDIPRTLRESVYLLAPLLAFAVIFVGVNHAQSGSALTPGYSQVHSTYGAFRNLHGELSNSLGGGLVRENAWLFGWPCSLLFVPLARVRDRRALFWGLVATGIVYRAIVPKTVVATTGPIYLTEIVPLLCIASVAGMQHAAQLLVRLGVADQRSRVAAVVAASFVVATLVFVPIEYREIRRGAEARNYVYQSLFEKKAAKAVVFCETLVPVAEAISWAYFAPNPWPDLRDDVLFLRIPEGADGPRRAFELWRSRFPDRPAFIYIPIHERGQLRRISSERSPAARTLVGTQTQTDDHFGGR